jgi:hypothetical protein
MPYDPQMRASDADRDRVASMLREHHAAGRLTADEFQERLDATFAAKTLGDLDKLMTDLPGIDLYHLPDSSVGHGPQPGPPAAGHGRMSSAWRGAWGSWASVSLLMFTIWLITAITSHSAAGLWFLWVAGPWGAILLGRWLTGGHPSGHPPRPVQRSPGGPVQQLQADQDASFGDLPSERLSRHEEHLRRREEHMRRHMDRARRRREF